MKGLMNSQLSPIAMHRFEEEDQEPVAVVRTLSDFALALTLIGTHSAADARNVAARAAVASQRGALANLNLLLAPGPSFVEGAKPASNAKDVASTWTRAHPGTAAKIVLQFRSDTLAKDLHAGLLELQSAFATNLSQIDTAPSP